MFTTSARRDWPNVASFLTLEWLDDRGARHELTAVLSYRCSDPFAVAMTLLAAEGNVVWTFGRDLLALGTCLATGDGDVHISPAVSLTGHALVSIELSSRDGRLLVLARTSDVNEFLTQTAALVAPGTEADYLDMDLLVTQLLSY